MRAFSMKSRGPRSKEPAGAPSPFEKAEHYRIEFAGEVSDAAAECDSGIEDARAVEMNAKIAACA